MTSLTSKYAGDKIGVLWDVEDCPILNGLDPKSIYENIKSALANQGYHGEVEITAYKEKEPIRNDFELAGIKLKIKGNKHGRFNSMFDDKYFWTRSNLMIISRDKTDFTTYLGHFKNVLIAEPAKLPENCCKCGFALDEKPNIKPIKKGLNISHEWVWTSLAFGGDPIPKTKTEKQETIYS
ncbi:hypothetical protein AALP_AA1G320000 [Arabis alpina]|uniref:NYN domain-containing protein n=1 Tax=Arabis alpina TaxID=50452 RepID=A0A087HS19_ARAAL|nr:hypothetical protein AALP_AA1G320000 [Arabis alpina]